MVAGKLLDAYSGVYYARPIQFKRKMLEESMQMFIKSVYYAFKINAV